MQGRFEMSEFKSGRRKSLHKNGTKAVGMAMEVTDLVCGMEVLSTSHRLRQSGLAAERVPTTTSASDSTVCGRRNLQLLQHLILTNIRRAPVQH